MRCEIASIFLVFAAGSAPAMPSVERGEYLVQEPMGCGNCHTPFGPGGFGMARDLGGRLIERNPAFTAIAPNITPGGTVAEWSEEAFARAIREGLRPEGSLIGPSMPYAMYRGLGDDDLTSIVMYLRRVPAVEGDSGMSVCNIDLPPTYGPPMNGVRTPEPGATAEYGAYISGPVIA